MSARWGKLSVVCVFFASCMIAPRAFGEDSAKSEAIATPAVARVDAKGSERVAVKEAVATTDDANLHVALKDSAIRKRWDDVISNMEKMEKDWTANGRHITPMVDMTKDGSDKMKDDRKKVESDRESRRIAEEEDKQKQKAREEVEALRRDSQKQASK